MTRLTKMTIENANRDQKDKKITKESNDRRK